jgi:hypothetical protein
MKEAEIPNIKEMNVSLSLAVVNEAKIKQLEARLKGPNSDGMLPVDCKPSQEFEIELIKSSNICIIKFRNFYKE